MRQHAVLKWQLISSAAQIKEPVTSDNGLSLVFFIIVIIVIDIIIVVMMIFFLE